MVEFALVILVLMTIMLGIIDFSRALYTYHFLSNTARQATRWAAVNGYTCADDTSTSDPGGSCNGTAGMNNGPASAPDIQTYVTNLVPAGMDPSKITTTVSWPVLPSTSADPSPVFCDKTSTYFIADNYPGCTVEVQVSYPFNFLYPLVRTTSITLSSSSEMVIAH